MSTATRESVDLSTGEVVETLPVLEGTGRAEIDQQISTAKRYPRKLFGANGVLDKVRSMVLHSEDIAASCCYSVPKGGRAIKGPSIRLAEIFLSAWGNIRVEARPGRVVDGFVTAEAAAWDLESNAAVKVEVTRRATDKHGRVYSTDVLQSTMNAAKSIALRDAVFRIIPKTYIHDMYDAAEELAVGKVESLAARRGKAIDFLSRYGITADRACARFGRTKVEELTLDDVAAMKSLVENVRRGETTIDEAFPEERAGDADRPTATGIADELGKQMDEAINKGKPDADPDAKAADIEARRKKLNESAAKGKDEKPKVPTCKPGKAGCGGDFSTIKIDGKPHALCAEHAPDFT